jgi:Asp-tRNA(Asn)/Glu-tRNA(Gln) amidotransferase A subunit family amidase
MYGVVRLLEVLVRLIDLQETSKQLEKDPFLESMKPRIDRLKILIMENPKEVQEGLDEAIREFTAELEKRTL